MNKKNEFARQVGQVVDVSLSLSQRGKKKSNIACRHSLPTFSVKATGTERASSCCPEAQQTRGISNVNGVCSKKLENSLKRFWSSWP